ncbi:threonine synthase [Chromatiales bacterium (ex Bugula neritina AB1)]|nr:threonine synthase [Chromatiales bacterium (ex Bugula neritina AB1)]
MIKYVSTKGGVSPVSFDEAVLGGFAEDGGLFVPQSIPEISSKQLHDWSGLSFTELAFELMSLYIPRSIVPAVDLKTLIEKSYRSFDSPDVVELVPVDEQGRVLVLELFHGPTLSFKDVAMGFLINVLDYILNKRGEHLSIVLATTGDTGPAAAWAAAGKKSLDCWALFPRGMITEEQERQMTTLNADNVHAVGVENCPNGGDDLDAVVAGLFEDLELKRKLKLSSVNSINWCRVMVQSVHYFYGYYRAVETPGESVVFSVPSGAFGNLFGGYLARTMGLPVGKFICANNSNNALHTVLSTGVFTRKELIQTMSSAIDIVVPYNFWRYLYFVSGCNSEQMTLWMDEFQTAGEVTFTSEVQSAIKDGFNSVSVSEAETGATIKRVFNERDGYLLDPHSAVAVSAAVSLKDTIPDQERIICLATAHPAKFPNIIRSCLGAGSELPAGGMHPALTRASKVCQHLRLCKLEHLEFAVVDAMKSRLGIKSDKVH